MSDGPPPTPPPAPAVTGGARPRAAWLIAGGILTVGALLAGTAMVGSSIWDREPQSSPQSTVVETEHRRHPRAAARLDLDVPVGDVSIGAGSPDRVEIERTLRWSGEPPVIHETWHGDTLRIVVDCPGAVPPRSRECKVDQVVQAPPDAGATIRTAAGLIEVRDVHGELSLSTASGAIALAGVTGTVSLSSAAGNVTGMGLRSPLVEVRLEAGTVDLRFAAAPAQVTVEVTAGNVTIEVPSGDPYQVRTQTTVGTEQVEVVQDPDADRVIEVRAGVGEIRIRYVS